MEKYREGQAFCIDIHQLKAKNKVMSKAPKTIAELRNLGPKTEAMLAQIGIHTATDFLALDPFVVYAQLHQAGIKMGLNGLYAMMAAQEDLAWQTVAQTCKEAILMRLDDMGLAPP